MNDNIDNQDVVVPEFDEVALSPVDTWVKALTSPNEATYQRIARDPEASIAKAVLWLAGAGFVGGFQYPLAVHLYYSLGKTKPKTVSESAGFLYAVDILGATIGALITGAVLIPLIGINSVAFLCAGINVAVLLLLLTVSVNKKKPY